MVSSHLKNIKLMREKLVFHVDCYGVGAVPDSFRAIRQPLVPYLYDRLQRLMLVLMGRFVKSSILEGVKTAYDLVKLNIKKEKRT